MERVNWLLTDSLEERYRNVQIKVIKRTPTFRKSFLSTKSQRKIVYLEAYLRKDIGIKIPLNKPMGRYFKSLGFKVKRELIWKFNIKISFWLKRKFNTNISRCNLGVYEFKIWQDNKFIVIATLIEVYSPEVDFDFKVEDQLKVFKLVRLPVNIKAKLHQFSVQI